MTNKKEEIDDIKQGQDEMFLEITLSNSFRKKLQDVRSKRRRFWNLVRAGKLKVVEDKDLR